MSEFKLKSHPNKLLFDHLKEVGDRSREEILSKDINLSLISKKYLTDLAYLIGISHDFGKAQKEFQDYISGKRKYGPTHSAVSSIFTFFLLKEFCSANGIDNVFAWIGYLCVKKHHSDLSEIDDINFNQYELIDQLSELKSNQEIKEIYKELLKEFNIDSNKIIDSLNYNENVFRKRDIFLILKHKKEEEKIELYLLAELLFSVLIDFDKKDAAGLLNRRTKIVSLPTKLVDGYLETMRKRYPKKFDPNKKTNKIKNQFYYQVTNNQKISATKYLYTITAPTGIGKTLTSLSLAMKLRGLTSQKYKIIYILPFTTLIDQNYEVFAEVIRSNFTNFEEDPSSFLLKHHYLSINNYENNNSETSEREYNYFDELLFIKSWESNIIVSTYIQLLKTIISSKSSFLNKFHNIVNSIIILDEVQFIGNEYWDVTNKIIKKFSEMFKTYFIFMTATQPIIFSNKEAIELSDQRFFEIDKKIKKRKLKYNKEKEELDKFSENLINYINIRKPNRVIIVMNTKKSSKKVYSHLKTSINDYELIYLSKNLNQRDIRERIRKIKRLKENDKFILVTTQLIEAGVDISSDVLYRDIAIAPSIIQSAGRCNRFNEIKDGEGEVKIINLTDNGSLLANYIYDPKYIRITREILDKETNENKITKLFFNRIKDDKNSDNLIEKIGKLEFKAADENFKLIKNDIPSEHVFLEQDEESSELLKAYFKLVKERTHKDFKIIGEIKKIRKQMEEYCLDINLTDFQYLKDKGYISDKGNFKYIKKEYVKDCYSNETGLNINKEEDNEAGII